MTQGTVLDKVTAFDWLLQRHVHEFFDVDGRPVGEGRARVYAQIETELQTCPYAGSRYQHEFPMNASALRSILPEWQHVLSMLYWLGQRYRAYNRTEISTFYDLARVSGCGVFLTDYMALRRSRPIPSHQYPIWMSGLYKVCLGFQQATFLAMMNDSFNSDEEKMLPDAQDFYTWLEQEELLIGANEVCGGSEVMINKAYEVLRGQHDKPQPIDQLPHIAEYDIDWVACDSFIANTSNLWRKVIMFVIQMHGFGIELRDQSLPADLREQLNNWLKQRFDALLNSQSGLAVEIARLTLAESGHSLDEWMTVQTKFLKEIDCAAVPQNHYAALTDAVMQALTRHFNLSGHEATVTAAVNEKMAQYEILESAVLRNFNDHLARILDALGYPESETLLKPEDLSALHGKILRDWPAMLID